MPDLTNMTMPSGLSKAEAFFWENAGWSYHPDKQTPEQGRTEGAQLLAAAEAFARDAGMRFKWEHETHPDRSGIEHDGPLWMCSAYVGGEEVEHLGNIDLGDGVDPWTGSEGHTYARVIEAELAYEHYDGEFK